LQPVAPGREAIRAALRYAAAQSTTGAHLDAIERQASAVIADAEWADPDECVPADFARQVLRRLSCIRDAHACGDAETACRQSLALARMLSRLAIQRVGHVMKQSRSGKARKNMRLALYIEMAESFVKQQRQFELMGESLSGTALMERIGRKHGLRRSAAIDGIKRGLAYLESRKHRYPDSGRGTVSPEARTEYNAATQKHNRSI
jgi:hypothetical protein